MGVGIAVLLEIIYRAGIKHATLHFDDRGNGRSHHDLVAFRFQTTGKGAVGIVNHGLVHVLIVVSVRQVIEQFSISVQCPDASTEFITYDAETHSYRTAGRYISANNTIFQQLKLCHEALIVEIVYRGAGIVPVRLLALFLRRLRHRGCGATFLGSTGVPSGAKSVP